MYPRLIATKASTIDFLLDQLASVNNVTSRKMFGEYALYVGGKVVAFVCDDQLYVKPLSAAKAYLGTVDERPAYPGSKMYYWIDPERWENREWLSELMEVTAAEVPMAKSKRK